jgi:uncharacterized protein (DUF302 family)
LGYFTGSLGQRKERREAFKIGIMLPCNVIVQEISPGKVEVAALDPVASIKAVANPGMADVAMAVQQKLRNVVTNLLKV